ncbi:hypothetical protein HYX12_04265, partial [Candidatus Woesearchaeota archaeon]|nr:hypothetical protein [Candidatus Woesearchaeota archaeon]
KEEISNWKYIHEQKEKVAHSKKKMPTAVVAHIFNYYEYLAYLIINEKIEKKSARKLWRPNILRMYEMFPEYFLGDRKELRKLYEQWKRPKA